MGLAEGKGVALRGEDRVITEAGVAAWRPDQVSDDLTLNGLHMIIGPGQTESADETGLPGLDDAASRLNLEDCVIHLGHSHGEIF